MNNLAVLVLSSNTYPSVRNSKVQKNIFFDQKDPVDEIYWYKQGTAKQLNGKDSNLIKKDLFINADDSSIGMGEKTILAFEWLVENSNFDFLFRTNTSSYISTVNLKKYINENYLDKEFVYSGLIHETNDKYKNPISFASGSGFLLNRNTVNLIIKKKELWQHEYWDDVSLGLLLRSQNITPTQGKRLDIEGNIYKQNIDLTNYHYRCRIDNYYGYPRFLETYVLRYLNKISNKNKYGTIRKNLLSSFFEFCKFVYVYQFGWKVYTLIRRILKNTIPKKLYNLLKRVLSKKVNQFKLKRFKI